MLKDLAFTTVTFGQVARLPVGPVVHGEMALLTSCQATTKGSVLWLATRHLGRTSKMKLSQPFFVAILTLLFSPLHLQAQTATVNWNSVDQVIDGFGASDAFEDRPLTSAEAALFFSPTTGVGLSLLRTRVPDDGSCSTVNANCAGEVSDMQLAIANGARVWSTPWSPPASMKSNASVDNGGSLLAGSYGSYATYLANYVESLRNLYGIRLYALSVQNEPDVVASYDSAVWTATDFDVFIKTNLGPTFAADGLTPLIVMPETSQWQELVEFASDTMGDPNAAGYVGINAVHDYEHVGASAYPLGQGEGKHLWETEVSDSAAFDPSIASALKYAQYINDWMTIANANAWHFWWLIGANDNDNEGLIDASGTVTKRLYMMGNYSKFVRPGFYRIDATATPQSGVSVSAYKNSTSGALVLVVINQNASSVSQSFILNGATISTVTPWITSASFDLVQQSDVTVSGGSFTYSLPASSITSFVGNTSNGPIPPAAPAPPTKLTATVR
jgi:glucuronoarabinoxylan endo-1,4-beta-xylanase